MKPTGMSEPGLGVGPMPSPVMPPLVNDDDQLSKSALEKSRKTTTAPPVTMSQSSDADPQEEGNPAGQGIGPSTSEPQGGSTENAVNVDEIEAKAEEMFILKPERLTDVYKFSGAMEFVALPKEGRAQKKSTIQSWRETEKNG